MKKNFFKYAVMLFMAFVGVMAVSSCSKDDGDESDLIGTWVLEEDDDEYITFINNNTAYYYEYKAGRTNPLSDVEKATYSYNGKTLKISFTEHGVTYTEEASVKVSGSTMTMIADGETAHAKKVKAPVTTEELEIAWQKRK